MDTWGELFWRGYIRTRIAFRNWKRDNWPPQFSSWQLFTATGIVSIILTLCLLPKLGKTPKLDDAAKNQAENGEAGTPQLDRSTNDPFDPFVERAQASPGENVAVTDSGITGDGFEPDQTAAMTDPEQGTGFDPDAPVDADAVLDPRAFASADESASVLESSTGDLTGDVVPDPTGDLPPDQTLALDAGNTEPVEEMPEDVDSIEAALKATEPNDFANDFVVETEVAPRVTTGRRNPILAAEEPAIDDDNGFEPATTSRIRPRVAPTETPADAANLRQYLDARIRNRVFPTETPDPEMTEELLDTDSEPAGRVVQPEIAEELTVPATERRTPAQAELSITDNSEVDTAPTSVLELDLGAAAGEAGELPRGPLPPSVSGNLFRFGEQEDAEEDRHSVTELRVEEIVLPPPMEPAVTFDSTDSSRRDSYRRMSDKEDEEEGRHSVRDLRPTRVGLVVIPGMKTTAASETVTEESQPSVARIHNPEIVETETISVNETSAEPSLDEPLTPTIVPEVTETPAVTETIEVTTPNSESGSDDDEDGSFGGSRTGKTNDVPVIRGTVVDAVPETEEPVAVESVPETPAATETIEVTTPNTESRSDDEDGSFSGNRTGQSNDVPVIRGRIVEDVTAEDEAMPEEPAVPEVTEEPAVPVTNKNRSGDDDEDGSFGGNRTGNSNDVPVIRGRITETPETEEPILVEPAAEESEAGIPEPSVTEFEPDTPAVMVEEEPQAENPLLPEFAEDPQPVTVSKPRNDRDLFEVEDDNPRGVAPVVPEEFQPPVQVGPTTPRTVPRTSPRVSIPTRMPDELLVEPVDPVVPTTVEEVVPEEPVVRPVPQVTETEPIRTQIDPPRPPARLAFTISGPETATVGTYVSLKFRVENQGEVPANKVVIADVLPPELEHRLSADLEYVVGDLAPGAIKETHMIVKCLATGPIINKAVVLSNGESLAEASVKLVGIPAKPDAKPTSPEPQPVTVKSVPGPSTTAKSPLTISHRGPERWLRNSPGQFLITVTNSSSQDLHEVVLTQLVPDGMALTHASPGGSIDLAQRSISWKIDRLPAGATFVLETELEAVISGPQASLVTVQLDGKTVQNFAWTAVAD